jgi:predicted RNA binding protein YcfA (HicA-like mRNA interferase family)
MGLCLSRQTVIEFLEAHGFAYERSRGTSHRIYRSGGISIPIPIHGKKDFGEELIRRILKESGLTKQELLHWLGRTSQ